MTNATLSLPVLTRRAGSTAASSGPALRDAHGRIIRDLRISVTDRCNMRCVYCMDPGTRFMPRADTLTADELARVARLFMSLGVTRVRITGGEPSVRPDLSEIIRRVAENSPDDLAMTTNGTSADPDRIRSWREAGLRRITFSLDAAEPEVFRRMTRSEANLHRIIEGIRASTTLGFGRVKVNAVLINGLNQCQAVPLARLARDLGVDLRFIEFMPLDGGQRWSLDHVRTAEQVKTDIGRVFPLVSVGREHPSATAEVYRFADGAPGSIGLIAPITRNFCGACDRVRVAADGSIRPCLFGAATGSLRDLLRRGASDDELRGEIVAAVMGKQAGHGIGSESFARSDVAMNTLGG